MTRLGYIFWAVGLLWLIGCSRDSRPIEMVRVYRPEVLAAETATPRPAGLLFDPPALIGRAGPQSPLGATALNLRPAQVSIGGYEPAPQVVRHRLYFHDRHPDGRAWFPGGIHTGRLYRTFTYTREGAYWQ